MPRAIPRAVVDGGIQPALRNYLLYLCLLRRDDYISRYDDADGGICPDFLASQSLQEKPCRGKGEQHYQGRTGIYVVYDRYRYDCLLSDFGVF